MVHLAYRSDQGEQAHAHLGMALTILWLQAVDDLLGHLGWAYFKDSELDVLDHCIDALASANLE